MVIYVEFRAHEKEHEGKLTPTGKNTYSGIDDFIGFIKERNLSLLVTDMGDAYGVGETIIAHLGEAKDEDVDYVEKQLKDRLHWPVLVAGRDPRFDVDEIRRFVRSVFDSGVHFLRLRKGRRGYEF